MGKDRLSLYGLNKDTLAYSQVEEQGPLKVKMKSLSHVRLFATPWTVDYQAPPSMEFSRQECWSGLPFPSPGDLSNPGIEPRSPALQADALPSDLIVLLFKMEIIIVLIKMVMRKLELLLIKY